MDTQYSRYTHKNCNINNKKTRNSQRKDRKTSDAFAIVTSKAPFLHCRIELAESSFANNCYFLKKYFDKENARFQNSWLIYDVK